MTELDGLTPDFLSSDPLLETSTQYITPTGTSIPSPLTAQTTYDSNSEMTYVNIHLPTGAGSPISSPQEKVTDFAVPISYEECTHTTGPKYFYRVGRYATYSPRSEVAANISTISVYSGETYDSYASQKTSFPVALLDPSGIDPTDFASLSYNNQPRTCMTSTMSVDYRHACSVGPDSRKGGSGCGDLNPCCFDCDAYNYYCVGKCARDSKQHHMKCADGLEYYSGTATPLDPEFTESPPMVTYDTDSTSIRISSSSARTGLWKRRYSIVYVFVLLGLAL